MCLTKEEREDTIIEGTIKKYLQGIQITHTSVTKIVACIAITLICCGALAEEQEYRRVWLKVEKQINEGIASGKYLLGKGPNSFGLIVAK